MLELKNVCKTFHVGSPDEKKALQNLSLTLNDGDFVTVLGSNGAGKSTLFNAIAGTFPIDSGSIKLDGQEISALPDYRRSKFIGRMFQDPMKGTAPNMTIEENLALAYLRASKKTSPFSRISERDRKDFREKLSRLGLGLEDRMHRQVGLLSGGQRQALTLLMATLVTPRLLLLDEHTAALDPETARRVLELTRKIVAENHITCMMITHSIPDALAMGNRTVLMHDGQIVQQLAGDVRKSMTPEALLELFRGSMLSDRILFCE